MKLHLLLCCCLLHRSFTLPIRLNHKNTPSQIHTNLYLPNQIAIHWATSNPTSISIVEWSITTSNTNSIDDNNDAPKTITQSTTTSQIYHFGNYISPWFHTVLLTVPPNAQIEYRCGDGLSMSDLYTLHTAPTSNDLFASTNTNLIVVSDLGQTSHSLQTIQHIQQQQVNIPIHAMLLPGDLSYADCDQSRWDSWADLTQDVSATIPLMVAPGNHDVEIQYHPPMCDDFNDLTAVPFLAYCTRYPMPRTCNKVHNLNTLNQDDPAQLFDAELNDLHQVKLFYSFNVGSIHVISLCSYCNYRPNSPQIKWLRDDLSSVKQPFIVVMTHVPLYHTNHAHHRASIHFINAFEQIFINGHVDLVLAGHVHAYERTHPLINGKVNTNGPMYIVIGDGGNREKLSNDWVLDKNEISAYKNGIDYGYGKLIANSTHVEWTWYKNNLKDMEASDRLVVKRRTVQNTDKK